MVLLNRIAKARGRKEIAFCAKSVCFALALFALWGISDGARASTFSVSYPDSPQLNIVVDLGGTPLPGENSIGDVLSITGDGPMYSPDNGDGWEAEAKATVTDNFGDSAFVDVYECSGFSCHPIDGSGFSFTSVPTSLQIDLGIGVPYDVGGPVDATATLTLFLPDGMYVTGVNTTPLPASLPLFASALAGLGLLGWCKRRDHLRSRHV